MKIKAHRASLSGAIRIPGSKAHTFRACMFAALAEGTSYIRNPLQSDDCIAAARAICSIGADVTFGDNVWVVKGAGKYAHLPENVVDVGSSGCALYMLAPIAATFNGWSVFTGNSKLCAKPVQQMLDLLNQLDCPAYKTRPNDNGAPVIMKGPLNSGLTVGDGHFSTPVTGILLAGARSIGKTEIRLTDPKETPYLEMTRRWFSMLGMKVSMSEDYKHLSIIGPQHFPSFDKIMPSDWEALAFPLTAGIITDSEFVITNADMTRTQGDAVIVDIFRAMGADIEIQEDANRPRSGRLTVRGGAKSRLPNKGVLHGIHINCSSCPDMLSALAIAACFAEGDTVLDDIDYSRYKAIDRIEIMVKELTELGVDVEVCENYVIIHGYGMEGARHFRGGTLESYDDHRIAMALAVAGLGLPEGEIIINDAECCDFSFPGFYDSMNVLNSDFIQL